MSTPPPYVDITGISRAAAKDNPQETITQYDGSARPGELVVDLESQPPNLYVGGVSGALHRIGPVIPGPYANDVAAAAAGIEVGESYYRPLGVVHVRLT
jgi:hypothetical protein